MKTFKDGSSSSHVYCKLSITIPFALHSLLKPLQIVVSHRRLIYPCKQKYFKLPYWYPGPYILVHRLEQLPLPLSPAHSKAWPLHYPRLINNRQLPCLLFFFFLMWTESNELKLPSTYVRQTSQIFVTRQLGEVPTIHLQQQLKALCQISSHWYVKQWK